MVKRVAVLGALLVTMLLVTAAPAWANKVDYSIILPAFGKDEFTANKTVQADKKFGVRHMYSGGKKVHFTVCNTSGTEIGEDKAISPGGADAPRKLLWRNNSSSAKTIKVKLETSWKVPVEVLAEGTWVWNY